MLLRKLTVHLGFTKRSLAATAVPSQNHPQRIACRFPSSLLATRAPAAVSHLPTSVQFPSPPRSVARSDWHTARLHCAEISHRQMAGGNLRGRRESALLYPLTWRCQPTASAPAVPAAAAAAAVAAAAAAQTRIVSSNHQVRQRRGRHSYLRGRRAGLLLLRGPSRRGLRRG